MSEGHSQALAHPRGQFGADDTVVATAPLADVVQQGTQDQQVRAGYPGGECACPRDGFDQVPVDGPGVHLIARRQVANRAPFREEPAPQPGAVERLDGGDRGGSGGQQNQQVVESVARPGCAQFGAVSASRPSVEAAIGMPVAAEAAATRMIRPGSRWGRASRARITSPASSTTPSSRDGARVGEGRRPRRGAGRWPRSAGSRRRSS